MIKNQKQGQWQGGLADQSKMSMNQTYGTGTDSQNQFRASYRSSNNPYGMRGPSVGAGVGGQMPQNNLGSQAAALQENFNILESREIQDNLALASNGDKARKMMLQKIVEQGTVPTLQLKVLSSAHLEKDFTLLINPLGVVPGQGNFDGQNSDGPRRGEYDGYTYFGVEDGTKASADDDDS